MDASLNIMTDNKRPLDPPGVEDGSMVEVKKQKVDSKSVVTAKKTKVEPEVRNGGDDDAGCCRCATSVKSIATIIASIVKYQYTFVRCAGTAKDICFDGTNYATEWAR